MIIIRLLGLHLRIMYLTFTTSIHTALLSLCETTYTVAEVSSIDIKRRIPREINASRRIIIRRLQICHRKRSITFSGFNYTLRLALSCVGMNRKLKFTYKQNIQYNTITGTQTHNTYIYMSKV